MHRLFRQTAAEQSLDVFHRGRLFLAIATGEIARPTLIDHVIQLRDLLGDGRPLVVEFPDSAVHATTEFLGLLTSLREAKIQVAYDGYAAGKAQITERKDVVPDFLKLVPSTFRSIHQGADRQRQVELLVRATHDIGCSVIATGIDNEADFEVCRELGCTLAQGNLFGRPQSTFALRNAPRAPAAARKPAK